MIRITKGQANTVTVTLYENSTTASPIYLFKFVNQQTAVSYYFIASDTSIYKRRYNQFTVTEMENPNTLIGQVELPHEGFYDYYVYETDLANTSGLTEASEAVGDIVKEVENGLVWVVPSPVTTITYEPQSTTAIVYKND